MSTPKGEVLVICCGGAGWNIGNQLEKHKGQVEDGFAMLQVVYVDASKSNSHKHINSDNSYVLEGLDGSGKVRRENHAEISRHIRAILQKFPSADLTIVLSSTGGGSGSVIAPLIMSELLEQNTPTVCIAIGGIESALAAENTLKTLKSYESIAGLRKLPVVMYYVQNKNVTSRDDPDPRIVADRGIIEIITGLCVLFSRENLELDSKDLAHWLNFNKVTSFKTPQLVALSLIEKTDDIPSNIGNIISVATLAVEGMTTPFPITPDYQCNGYIPESCTDTLKGRIPMHFVTSDGIIKGEYNHLSKILADAAARQKARLASESILTKVDQPDTDTGLVL